MAEEQIHPTAMSPSPDRYFINNIQQIRKVDAHQEFMASLARINLYKPPVKTCSTGWTFHGFYAGPTSIAYCFWRLHELYPGLQLRGQSLLDWAQAYLDVGAAVTTRNVDSSHCGIANESLAQLSLRAVIDQDPSLVRQVCDYAGVINAATNSGSNEWLYGRAGYLYLLRLVRRGFAPTQQPYLESLINRAIDRTIDGILAIPQPWTWHGKSYLGAAHGSIGIIAQMVLSRPPVAPALQSLLAQILDTQFPSGNFPSSLPASSDRLVQFCHGGPGMVLALQSIQSYFPDLAPKIRKAIACAQEDVWNRGLLTKTPCLCHGIAGNALALPTQDQIEHFMAHMSSVSMEENGWLHDAGPSDVLVELYEGEAGRAWAWAILDKGVEATCIGFNDL